MISDDATIEQSMNRSEQILQVLEDTFGEDHPTFKAAMDRYTQIIEQGDGEGINYLTSATYLEWGVAYPRRIGHRRDRQPCRCDNKWILENEEEKRYRPCPNCLPDAHDKWVGRSFENEEDEPDGML